MEDNHAFYAAVKQSLCSRFWSWCGFHHAYAEPRNDVEGLADGHMIVGTFVSVDWLDRLRILISGKIDVQQAIRTDVLVSRSVASSAFAVLPPGHPMIGAPDA